MNFSHLLANWYRQNARVLPWRETNDPYFIWLSEIIMQQTRVAQGTSYYLKFCKYFPTIIDLANADEQEVLNLWQGLGYYSRARNLHAAAKFVRDDCKGVFPSTFLDLKKMKGVGDYSAAAISSFAFNLPHAVVDGNVYRVLSRVYGIETAIDSNKGIKEFAKLAQEVLDKSDPATHNQSIMEFGAIQCVPKNPICDECIFSNFCVAKNQGLVSDLPFKSKKNKVRNRFLNYFYTTTMEGNILLKKRTDKDVWLHLFEFPLLETEFFAEFEQIEKFVEFELKGKIVGEVYQIKHILSHQHLHASIWQINTNLLLLDGFENISKKDVYKYPIPRLLEKFLDQL
jgi:A/G-specific adenine glycosylase